MAPLLHIVLGLLSLARTGVTVDQCGWNIPSASSPLNRGSPYCPHAIDESVDSNPQHWAPWTHKPYCAPSGFCVFTNAMVAQDRGISIVTTPLMAASTTNLKDYDFTTMLPQNNVTSRAYEIKYISGKGKGLIATRKIEKGSVLMIDHAAVLAPIVLSKHVTQRQQKLMLHHAVYRLGEPESVLGLTYKGNPGATRVEDILITNSFGCFIQGESFMGLFPEVSRINHACNPNAFSHFSERTLALTIWTSQDIEAGDEITISYSDVELTHEERQKMLLDAWGFKCTCALCSASKAKIEDSNRRRTRIRELKEEVLTLSLKGKYRKAIELSEELLDHAEHEGLAAHISDFYEIPAKLYFSVGNMQAAEKFALLALDDLQKYGPVGEVGRQRMKGLTDLLAATKKLLYGKKNR